MNLRGIKQRRSQMARYDNNFEQDDEGRGGRYGDQDTSRRASGENGRRRNRDWSGDEDDRGGDGDQRRQPLAGLSASRGNPYTDEDDRGRYGNERDGGRGGYSGRGNDGRRYQGQEGRDQDDQGDFDSDYRRWRDEQVRSFDEDYKAFRTERAKKFGTDFNEFRQGRERSAQKGSASTRKGSPGSDTQN
jgi:hypothetical protein